ncbi:MAG: protein-L-isoaspartate(D-aspartate) O-methyltransferase [Calditrichia bacterium]|nr:protein-L-isoaspartate(D-aspartate) O-methyltransferase [Calditrichia bacterium]
MFTERIKKLKKELIFKYNVTDEKVLEAIGNVPRHRFVEISLKSQAYHNAALPIGFAQTISRPSTVALMTELLEVKGDEKVLEIGTGSGYQAAVLAEIGCRVFTMERIKGLYERTRKLLEELNYYNVIPHLADGGRGWPSEAPFDRIIITASVHLFDDIIFAQLAENGIMVAPVGKGEKQELFKFIRKDNKIYDYKVTDAHFVPLLNGKS